MSILTRTLLVLMTLRLLLPPGLCLCKLTAPASVLLISLLGGPGDPPPNDHDDDHHPGCPASSLAPGLGVQPSAPPAIDLAPAGVVNVPPVLPPSSLASVVSPRAPDPPSAPRHLALCVLLV